MKNDFVIITIDCGPMGSYPHLYRDGNLVDEAIGQPDDGWYDIPWKVALKILGIPFGSIRFDDCDLSEENSEAIYERLEQWYDN